jgi:hypothetical protein
MFTFPQIEGNPDAVLNEPFTVLLSQNTAKKYFGNRDPIGKRFSVDADMKAAGPVDLSFVRAQRLFDRLYRRLFQVSQSGRLESCRLAAV